MSDAIDRAAEAKVRELEHDRNLWRERAENGEPRPEVTKDDIAKAIRDGLYDDKTGRDLIREIALARAIEAEATVDPVEQQTDALADILYGHEMVTDQMRGVLERVVRAGMLLPEQEASSDE